MRSLELQERLGALSARSLSGTVWAHTKLGHGPLRMLAAAAPHVRARAADMNLQARGSAARALFMQAVAATDGKHRFLVVDKLGRRRWQT